MKRRITPTLITIPCKRCGKLLCSLDAPIYTSISTMNKYQGLCEDCVTPKEKEQLMQDAAEDVHNYIAKL